MENQNNKQCNLKLLAEVTCNICVGKFCASSMEEEIHLTYNLACNVIIMLYRFLNDLSANKGVVLALEGNIQ